MKDFLACRGTVFIVKTAGGSERSFKLRPGLVGTDESPILLQHLNLTTRAVDLPVNTLDGFRILYVFGEAWGEISIGGMALLGAGGAGDALAKVVDLYNNYGVGKGSDKTMQASLPGGKSCSFYLTGLMIGEPDPELQYFTFAYSGKITTVN
jgi:hypothetical protein